MAAACRYNLGLLEILEGRFARARRHLEDARVELEREKGSIYRLYARVGLAELDLHEGNWDRGFAEIAELRAAFVERGDERAIAWLHRELARVYTAIGAVEAAEPEAAAARLAFRRLGVAPEAAHVAFLEGRCALASGAIVDAFARFEEARAHWERAGNRRALHRVTIERARAMLARGDADGALASLASTLRYFDRVDRFGDSAVARSLAAECHLAAGRAGRAESLASRAYADARRHPANLERPRMAVLLARVHAARGDARNVVRWARRAVDDLERVLLRFGRRNLRVLVGGARDHVYQRAIDLVLDHAGPRAAEIAVDLLARARSPSLIEDLLQGRETRLGRETRAAIVRLRDELLAGSEETPGDTRSRAISGRIHDLERRLGAGPSRTPAIVRDALERRGFAAWRDRVVDADVVLFDRGASGWRALVVHPGGRVDVVGLPAADEAIRRRWLPLRITLETAAFASPPRRREFLERTRSDSVDLLDELRRAIWEPITLSTNRAIAIPWDELHALPLEAFAPDGVVASRLPHPVLLRRTRSRRRRSAILLHGGTDGSRAEVRRVARRLRKGGYRVRVGGNRRALERRAKPVGVLHVAAHGTFHREGWFLSGIQLEGGSLGFEQLGPKQLRNALVQFTSCESGQTRALPGSDIDGWITAGLAAGAREMVLTLWKIDDEAGIAFADHFYRAWTAGSSAAEAAARARTAMRRHDPHPYRWAPFVAVG